MKRKFKVALLAVLAAVLLCSCKGKENSAYKDLAFGAHDVHLSNLGDSLQQVKDAEGAEPNNVLDADRAENMFGPNTAYVQYTNRTFAGMEAKYTYIFKDDKLGEGIIYLKTDTPAKVYKEMTQYFDGAVGKSTESGGDGQSKDSYTIYKKDGKVLDLFIGSNNQVVVDVFVDGKPLAGGK